MASSENHEGKLHLAHSLPERYILNDLYFEIKKVKVSKKSDFSEIYSKIEYLNEKITFLNERVNSLNERISLLKHDMSQRLETFQGKVRKLHKKLVIALSITVFVTVIYLLYFIWSNADI